MGGRLILDHVTLSLEAGRVAGILGQNGADKGVLLLGVLTGLRRLSSGRGTVLGKPCQLTARSSGG